MIFTGVVSLLSLVTLQQDLGAVAGVADAPSLVTTGASLTAGYNWAFTVGQSLMPAFNALLLGTLLYRSGLVPRVLPTLGLIGAPILIAATVATMFGVVEQYSALGGARRTADRRVGVLARSLPDLQGLPEGRPDHGRGRRRGGGDHGWLGDGGPTAGRDRDHGRCGMTADAGQTRRTPPRFVIRTFWVLHRAMYRFSGGRFGLSRPKAGGKFGMMRLTTIGRRSGEPRVAIVGYYEDGPNLVTLAMNGWADAEPAWWLNLQAHPDTVVELKDGPRAVRARAAVGEERDRLWARWGEFSDQYDGWAAMRSRPTAVVVLEPRTTT